MNSPQKYEKEIWSVEKDVVYSSIYSIESGLEYAREVLSQHDINLGRTTGKNKGWAETIESDIKKMESTLKQLKAQPCTNS